MNIYLKGTLFIFLFLIILSSAFLYGTIYNPYLYRQIVGIPQNKFLCNGINNLFETYQVDCFVPLPKEPFEYKNHLECQRLTQHGFSHHLESDKYITNSIVSTKVDYLHFTLDITDNKITISKDHGAVFTPPIFRITQNDTDTIEAISESNKNDREKFLIPNSDISIDEDQSYNYIVMSKKTGRGMTSINSLWNEQNVISVNFFQCK